MKRTLSVALLLLAALAPAQAQTLIIPPAATSFSVAQPGQTAVTPR